MSVQIVDATDGLVTVKITGQISPAEQTEFQKRLVALARKEGRVNLLVLAHEFQGWAKGDWSDISFQPQFDQHIGKMALVGDIKWKDEVVLFTGKGLRRVEIEMFPDAEKARAWLGAQA